MDDDGKTISKIDIDTEAYTGEDPSCSEKNRPLDGIQRGESRMGLPQTINTGD